MKNWILLLFGVCLATSYGQVVDVTTVSGATARWQQAADNDAELETDIGANAAAIALKANASILANLGALESQLSVDFIIASEISSIANLTSLLSLTGTAGSTTYLRGDGTWAALPADDDSPDDDSEVPDNITVTGSVAAATVDASGFSGNLDTGDDTIQEIANKVDGLSLGGGSGLTYVTATDIDSGTPTLTWGNHYINDINTNADVGASFSGTPVNGSQLIWSGNVSSGPVTFDFPTAAHRTGADGTADQVTLNDGYNFLVFEYLDSEIILTDSGTIVSTDWMSIQLSAMGSDITTGEKQFWRVPYDLTITAVTIDMNVAPVGSTANFDLEVGGTSIFSTEPTIDAGETSTDTAATASVVSDASHSAGDIITFDIVQIGSGTAGQAPMVTILYRRFE